MTITNSFENTLLDILDDYTVYVKLHVGDPGEDAVLSPATETTRKLVTFSAASSGQKASSNAPSWTSLPATETITHISLWTAATAGTPLFYGALTSSIAVRVGHSLTFNAGALVVTLD